MNDFLAVIVQFPTGFPGDLEGPSLLSFEKQLRRRTGMDVRVFKEKMADDSKLRSLLTPEERDRL